MISKKELLHKIKKNKIPVLVISAIVIMSIYFGFEKAIDSYIFKTNSDIVASEEFDEGESAEELRGGGQISGDEVDFEIEESGEPGEIMNASGEEEKSEENSEKIEQGADPKDRIFVYVTGEVNIPGVVILDKGSRIVDAINAAGGTTVNANITKVNLVYILEDGMKVNIPSNNDLKSNDVFEYITLNSGDGASDKSSKFDSSTLAGDNNSLADGEMKYGVVNINTATQTELESLPGIGPSLALKIINYRKQNGNFSSVEEIKNVSGIGDSKFENIKNFISI